MLDDKKLPMTKQIIAAGGDLLTDIPLHYYLLAQSNSEKPKVCLLPTASGDNEGVIRAFYTFFGHYHCKLDHLPLFHNKEKNIREFILKQDILVFCGGQSKSALGVYREWGLDKIFLEAYENGVIMAGGSAGSVVWFKSALTDSYGDLRPMDFLNFLPFSHCPHYRAHERRVAYKSAILEKRIIPGYAVNDGGAVHFVDGKFLRAVSSDYNASSFYVDIDTSGKEDKIKSERLQSSWLVSKIVQEELIWPAPAFRYLDKPAEPTATSIVVRDPDANLAAGC